MSTSRSIAYLKTSYIQHVNDIVSDMLCDIALKEKSEKEKIKQRIETINKSMDLLFADICKHLEQTLDKSIERDWHAPQITLMTLPANKKYAQNTALYLIAGPKNVNLDMEECGIVSILTRVSRIMNDVQIRYNIRENKKKTFIDIYVKTNEFRQVYQ